MLFKETIKNKIIKGTKKKIDQQIKIVRDELNKKTITYALWSLLGILLIILQPPKIIFFILSSMLLSFALYLIAHSMKSLKTIFSFINNFDKKIKEGVEKEIKNQTEKSWKNKLGLWASMQNNTDIEDRFISHTVRELARRFKKHKWLIIIRITAYTTAVLLFKEVLLHIFL